MTQFSPQGRRLIAILLLVLVCLLPYYLVIKPIADLYGRYEQDLADEAGVLARYRAVIALGPSLKTQRDRLLQDPATHGIYLSGRTDSLVAADLQKRLSTLIEHNEARLTSVQVLDPTDDKGFRRVTVRLRLTASTAALQKTLYAIETGRPFLMVEMIDIQPVRGGIPNRGTYDESVADLNVNLEIAGYMPVQSES